MSRAYHGVICTLCRMPYHGRGHNCEPVNPGRCCDTCNTTIVIPARLAQFVQTVPALISEEDCRRRGAVHVFPSTRARNVEEQVRLLENKVAELEEQMRVLKSEYRIAPRGRQSSS